MNAQVIKKRIRKVFAYLVTGLLFVVISSFLVLQIPAVQENLIKRYLGDFSKVTGFQSTIQSFQLLWFDRLELKGVKVLDTENNEMIAAETIVINFELAQLFKQQDVHIDGVFVEGARVLVTKVHESDTSKELNVNVFVDRINEAYGGTGKGGRNPRINIGEAILNESVFSYIDQYRDSIKNGFNYNQFTIDINESQLQSFLILGDTTEFKVNTLLASDRKTGFRVKQLSTFFRLSQLSMEFLGLDMQAGNSTISDTIVFRYNGQRELSDFITKVDIHANLENTIIQPKDLALFAPDAERLTQPIYVTGEFNGRVNNFNLKDMEIGTGNTTLRGSLDLEGLPDINETFIILTLKDSRLDFNDLSFLFNNQVMNRLTPIGRVALEGEFLGYPTDFVAKGQFLGNLGKIESDINFKVNEDDFDRSVYSGKLALTDFSLGRYLKDTANFQQVTLNGNVKGSGLTLKTADFKLNGRVRSIGIRKYNYRNITTNARFAAQLFNGLIKINDANLQLSAEGTVDLREGFNSIKMKAQLDTANLQMLKLSQRDIFLHAGANIDIKGLHIDSITGTTDIKDFQIRYNDKWLKVPDIHVAAERSSRQRKIQLETNLVDAQINGNFLISDISKDMRTLVQEILLNIRNDKQAIADYYAEKNYRPKSYQAKFKIGINDIEPITNLLNTDLTVSNGSTIEGSFTSGYTSILQAFTNIDSIRFNKTMFHNTEVELTASKIADSTSVLAMAFVNSDKQQFTPAFRTKNLVAEAIWNQNHIDFALDGDQDGQSNYLRLKGGVNFMRDSTHLKLEPSSVKVLDKIWHFNDKNLISVKGQELNVHNLVISNENQYIKADGLVSQDPAKELRLQIHNFDLSMLNPITGRSLTGTLNAMLGLTNYYSDPYVQNDITIDSLTVDKFLVGDITGKNKWNNREKKFLINFFVDRQDERIVNVEGFYNPAEENSPLNVDARLENANLKILEPFLDDIFSNIGGTVTGDFAITGKMSKPLIDGQGEVENGQFMVNYLKTLYRFSGTIGMTPESIDFKNITLQDMFNNDARLSGSIQHDNFYSMRINLDASFQDFQVLNTTAKDNSLFYGQGFATGDLNIFGPVWNLKFTANARTERNTRIFIPIGGTSEVERKEFIKFVSFNDSTFQQSLVKEIENKVDLTGITMDFNLDVTPDAFCEIILDLKAGDIIRGRGNGDLQLQFDTKGEFNMFGPFEFTEGAYNFTLYDIVNKDFLINKGSRITWYGDPYAGVLDIGASYNQLASLAPILSNQTLASSPTMRRKYPVQVLLDLTGPMLNPTIDFDISAADLPQSVVTEKNESVSLAFEFQAFKNRLDDQELYRQVFSLVVLRRFSPPESFNASGSLANSVSELLSNQLSNWMSQVDENLEIDIDLSTFDEEAYNTFQLRLSYTFMNGRLRITRDATTFYGNQNTPPGTTPQQQNSIASIAGDWTVDYLLTPEGKWRVKMYNRTNINPILNSISAQTPVTTGVSLLNTHSFNELKDLWKSNRKRQEEEEDPDADANEEAVKNDEDGTE